MSGERSQPDGHVFVSYVHEDASRVDRVVRDLEAAGLRVWRDTSSLRPGQDWKLEIRRAIDDGSLVFLACFSRAGTERSSTYQNEELRVAIDQLRTRPPGASWLIPVRFDECLLPDFDLGNGRNLASFQRVDLFDDYPSAIDRLIGAIRSIADTAPDPSSTTATPGASQGLEDPGRPRSAPSPGATPPEPRSAGSEVGTTVPGEVLRRHLRPVALGLIVVTTALAVTLPRSAPTDPPNPRSSTTQPGAQSSSPQVDLPSTTPTTSSTWSTSPTAPPPTQSGSTDLLAIAQSFYTLGGSASIAFSDENSAGARATLASYQQSGEFLPPASPFTTGLSLGGYMAGGVSIKVALASKLSSRVAVNNIRLVNITRGPIATGMVLSVAAGGGDPVETVGFNLDAPVASEITDGSTGTLGDRYFEKQTIPVQGEDKAVELLVYPGVASYEFSVALDYSVNGVPKTSYVTGSSFPGAAPLRFRTTGLLCGTPFGVDKGMASKVKGLRYRMVYQTQLDTVTGKLSFNRVDPGAWVERGCLANT